MAKEAQVVLPFAMFCLCFCDECATGSDFARILHDIALTPVRVSLLRPTIPINHAASMNGRIVALKFIKHPPGEHPTLGRFRFASLLRRPRVLYFKFIQAYSRIGCSRQM